MGGSTLVSNQPINLDGPHESFPAYFRRSRLLHIGLFFNLIYYIAIVFVYLILYSTGSISTTVYSMDIQVFYEAGRVLLVSPGDLYSVSPNGLPFRYFPLFSYVYAILQPIPLEVLYLINCSIMMLLNWGVLWLSYRLCLAYGLISNTKNFEKTLLFIFIAPQHIVNLILGQFSQFLIFLILYAILLLQKADLHSVRQYFFVGIALGMASNLKPFAVILFVFAVPVFRISRYKFGIPWRPLLGVFLGFMLMMIPNAIFFWIYPESLSGFIRVNFFENLDNHHSTSITRLLTSLFPLLQNPIPKYTIMLAMSLFIFFISYSRFVNTPQESKKYILHFAEMLFLVLLIYPDSWFLFLAIWYTVLGPSMLLFYNSYDSSQTEHKVTDILWAGSNNLLAFFWIGVLLHYLVLGFDPIGPIWLLLVYVLFIYLVKRPNKLLKHNKDQLGKKDLITR
ncbi:hypothetical protein EU527_01430 [Candidatus Thorarchaeota archaeon]|nr:MAG: hypothetical protein EU527_01430 [Candidatus Thorarchaeota archaeon]